MFTNSIAYRLSIYISLAVIGVFMAFIMVSYFFDKNLMKENVENRAMGVSSELMVAVNNNLFTTKEIASNVAEQALYYAEHGDIEPFVYRLMEKYEFINAIHINVDSSYAHIKSHNYFTIRLNDTIRFEQSNKNIFDCPYEKEIIRRISETKKPGWAQPFHCPINQAIVVSYYSPILMEVSNGNSEIVGEVICELSLFELNELLNSVDLEHNGIAFLISKNGDYITHPVKEWILNRNIAEIPDKIYGKKGSDENRQIVIDAISQQRTGTFTVYAEIYDFKKTWTHYTPVTEIGWSLIIAFPYDDLFAPLYKVLLKMLFFSALGILIIFAIITFLSTKLIEPLSMATARLKKFSSLTGDHEIDTLNEVEQVSESLNYLQSWYEQYKIDVNQEKNKSRLRMQDLDQASEIQQSLIKIGAADFSDRSDIDLFALYKPAKVVSGDLFDYFFIDNDNLLFTMGDVSGKGIPAALFMSVSQTIIKSNARYKKPGRIVSRVNNELHTTNQHQFFLTLFLGILNLKTGVLTFCNAAHSPTYIIKKGGDIIELNQTHGLPLGLYPNRKYSDSKINLEKGDSIVVYTDGVTELQNENKTHFGHERFVENLRFLMDSEPEKLVTKIERSLELYRGNQKQVDDITIMNIKYKA